MKLVINQSKCIRYHIVSVMVMSYLFLFLALHVHFNVCQYFTRYDYSVPSAQSFRSRRKAGIPKQIFNICKYCADSVPGIWQKTDGELSQQFEMKD